LVDARSPRKMRAQDARLFVLAVLQRLGPDHAGAVLADDGVVRRFDDCDPLHGATLGGAPVLLGVETPEAELPRKRQGHVDLRLAQ